jgi:hypothetical protein
MVVVDLFVRWVKDICAGEVRVWLGVYMPTWPVGHGAVWAKAGAARVAARDRARA